MRTLRLSWRLFFFVSYTALIIAEIYLRGLLNGRDMRAAMRIRRRWARRLLYTAGVRIDVEGVAPGETCLLVSNHRSYLDPILLLRNVDAYPVAMAEISKWPMLGKGARLAGILYVDRERPGSRSATLLRMAEKMKAGFSIILFPEGTTSGLAGTLPFKKGAFQMAAKHSFSVAPVALCFDDPDDFWITEETFLTHAQRRFKEKYIRVKICYGETIQSDDPEALLTQAQQWIDHQLLAHRQTAMKYTT